MGNEVNVMVTQKTGGFVGGGLSAGPMDIINSPHFELKSANNDLFNDGCDIDIVIKRITHYTQSHGRTPAQVG